MEKYGFVYIWRDRKHNRYYIGSHWGFEDDGYICSSNWAYNSYKRRPEDFKRRILSRIYTSKQETFKEEFKWLSKIKPEEIRKRYYNICLIPPLRKGKKHKNTKPRKKGIIPWNKGKKGVYSKESQEKRSKSLKGKTLGRKHSEESKLKIKEKRLLQILTEEHKKSISLALKNVPKSQEHKENISKSKLGEDNPMSKKNREKRKLLTHKEGL